MKHPVAIVFAKEVRENLRDHRVVLSALFFGVVLAPVIFSLTTTFVSRRAIDSQDEALKLAVAGAQYAPNLVAFLRENGADVTAVNLSLAQAEQSVGEGTQEVVLVLDKTYGERLASGESAPVRLVVDSSNTRNTGTERAYQLLEAYGRQLAALRLLARGVSPAIAVPVDVRTHDVATPASRSLLLLGMMTYFCFMSMLMGGFYLAIDTTAGERERGSLEPLLSLPVTRAALLIGKMFATAAFMTVSLLLTLAAFGVALAFIPLEALGMSANFGPRVIAGIFAVMVTFVPLGAGLMTLVASFTRSNREAQSWLSLVMLIPMAPIMVAVLSGLKSSAALMTVPSLSQHLLATNFMRGDAIPPLHLAISAATTLLAGAALLWLAVRFYQREAILG